MCSYKSKSPTSDPTTAPAAIETVQALSTADKANTTESLSTKKKGRSSLLIPRAGVNTSGASAGVST